MRDFTLGTRLRIGFAVVTALALAVGAFAYSKIADINQTADQIATSTLAAVHLSEDLRANLLRQNALLQRHLATSNQAQLARLDEAILSERDRNGSIFAKYEAASAGQRQKTALNSLKAARDTYIGSLDAVLKLSRTGSEPDKIQALEMTDQRLRPAYDSYLECADTLLASNWNMLDDQHQNLAAVAFDTSNGIIVAVVSATILSILVSWFVIRGITAPLAEARSVLAAVSQGDLLCRAEVQSSDELGDLLLLLNQVLDNHWSAAVSAERLANGELGAHVNVLRPQDILGASLLRIRNNLQSLAEFAELLARGEFTDTRLFSDKDTLGQALLRVRDHLKTFTATKPDFTTSLNVIDKISEGDLSVTLETSDDPLGSALQRMLEGLRLKIREIESSASAFTTLSERLLTTEAVNQMTEVVRQVADKINIFEEIARKTDLLTFAAALEANRAGEHGISFAFVASEMRKLGERSQTTATELTRLVTNGLKVAGNGRDLASVQSSGRELVSEAARLQSSLSFFKLEQPHEALTKVAAI
jgi:methyl-accepting chemotaxis protein